jgi:hypothetical protein
LFKATKKNENRTTQCSKFIFKLDHAQHYKTEVADERLAHGVRAAGPVPSRSSVWFGGRDGSVYPLRFFILSRYRIGREAGGEKPTITTTGYTYVRPRHGESIYTYVEPFLQCTEM